MPSLILPQISNLLPHASGIQCMDRKYPSSWGPFHHFGSSRRTLLPLQSTVRGAGFSPLYLEPLGLGQDRCHSHFLSLYPNHCFTFLYENNQHRNDIGQYHLPLSFWQTFTDSLRLIPGLLSLSRTLYPWYFWWFQYSCRWIVQYSFSNSTSSPSNISYSILPQPFTRMVLPCDLVLTKNLIPSRILISSFLISEHYFYLFYFYYFVIYFHLPMSFVFLHHPHFLASSPGVITIPNFSLLISFVFKMTVTHMYIFLNSIAV